MNRASTGRSRWRRAASSTFAIDGALAVAVALVAYLVAMRTMAGSMAAPWIEDLLVPCTGQPGWVPDPVALQAMPQWRALVAREIDFFPCEAIHGMPLIEVGSSWRQVEYFHRSLSAWFTVTGPSIRGFVTFQSAFFAASSAIAFLLFRVGVGRVLALACAAGLILSKSQLEAATLPIEYAKAPWILATVLFCALMVRREIESRPIAVWAMLAGLAAGIGVGFKPDVIAAIPLAFLTAVCFVGGWINALKRKGLAILCITAGVLVGAGPIVYHNWQLTSGSLLGVQFLGGQDSAGEALYAASPLYDYGLTFDDSQITALLNVYGRRVAHIEAPVYFFSQEMQQISSHLLIELWSSFPGDFVLRVGAAIIRILQFGQAGLAMACLGLLALTVFDRRAGFFALLSTVYLAGYVSLVFQRRHFFHLEFINWWLAAFCLHAGWLWVRHLAGSRPLPVAITVRRVLSAVGLLLLVVLGAAALLAAAREYQHRVLGPLLETYVSGPFDAHSVARQPVDDQDVVIKVAGITDASESSTWRPDTMRGDYLVARFACGDTDSLRVRVAYHPPGDRWNREIMMPCAPTGDSMMMVPIYQYGTVYRFEGLVMRRVDADRLTFVGTAAGPRVTGPWLQLSLPSDWKTRPLHKTMKFPLGMP